MATNRRRTTRSRSSRKRPPETRGIRLVDCDVHHATAENDDLYPYLPKHYVEYIKDFGSMMPGVGYTNMPRKGCRGELWDHTDVHPSANIDLPASTT